MREKSGPRACSSVPDLLQSCRKSGFAERADRQAGQRDSDLHAGNDAVQIRKQALNDAARISPLATSWRTRESRTATRENSAAAKKPLRATSASTPINRTANIVSQGSPSGIVAVREKSARRACLLYTRVIVTKISSPLSASLTPPFWLGLISSRSARSSLRRNASCAVMASAMRGEAE